MTKLSCTTLVAVVGSAMASAAFAETLTYPTTPQIVPQPENIVRIDDAQLRNRVWLPQAEQSVNQTMNRDGVRESRELAAARTATGDTYSFFGLIAGEIITDQPAWAPSTAYAVGDIVEPTAGAVGFVRYVATTAGTSGAAEPFNTVTPPALGDTVNDNGIIWQAIEDDPFFVSYSTEENAPPLPGDPNYGVGTDGIPFTADDVGDAPAQSLLFTFQDGAAGVEFQGRNFVGINFDVIEFEDVLANGDVVLEVQMFGNDLNGGDWVPFGTQFVVDDPNDPLNPTPATVDVPITLLGPQLGNNFFADETRIPQEGDPGWEGNALDHGVPNATLLDAGSGIFFDNVGLNVGGLGSRPVPGVSYPDFAPVFLGTNLFTLPTANFPDTFRAPFQVDSSQAVASAIFIGFTSGAPVDAFGFTRFSQFYQLAPDVVTATGACCIPGGTNQDLTPAACLAANGTFFGIGSAIADINCPDCSALAVNNAFQDEASFGGFDDDDFAGNINENAGCTGASNFTILDFPGDAQQGPAQNPGGTDEVVIGTGWQGTVGTFADGTNDEDWWLFTPAADGTITVTASAEAPVIINVVQGTAGDGNFGCSGFAVLNNALVGGSSADGNCGPVTFKTNVAANVPHYIVVAVEGSVEFLTSQDQTSLNGTGVYGYEFIANIGALETGACVTVADCTQQLSADCFAANGIAFQPGISCAEALPTGPFCPGIWAPGGVMEMETEVCRTDPADLVEPTFVVDNVNGGFCDAGVIVSDPLSDGVPANGEMTMWQYDDITIGQFLFQRDIDTYEYVHPGGDLDITVDAQFSSVLDVLDASCDANDVLTGTILAGEIRRNPNDPVGSGDCNQNTLSIPGLAAGTYYIRLTSDFDTDTLCVVDPAEPLRYSLVASSGSACVPCPDGSGGGLVDGADLLAVINNFGNAVNPGDPGNTNCDSIVDGADLLAVINNFGNVVSCP